jgi:Flp pilus assembly protein TadG
MVEFALVLPIFMLLLFGIIDGGRVVYANNELAQATRIVARVASTACFETTPACDKTTGPIAAAITSQRSSGLVAATWTVSCINPATNTARTNAGADICKIGDRIAVSASSPFGFVTPVASSIGSVTVGSRTEQEILQ